MIRECPNPWCHRGVVCCVAGALSRNEPRHRRCPTCHGAGAVEEDDEDLRAAGIYVWDRTDEDFRSSPNHWRG